MDPEDVFLYIFLFLLFFGGGSAAFVRNMLEGRQRHQLELKRLEVEKAKAEAAREQALLTSKAMETRQAELAIEQFDRRTLEAGVEPPPRLPSAVDPDVVNRTIGKASQLESQKPPITDPQAEQE